MAWSQEQKNAVIEAYEIEEPTAETTEEIMAGIADDTQNDEQPRSINAIRRILTNAGVYVKKDGKAAATTAGGKEKKTRVTPKAKALASFAAICELNSVSFMLDEEDTKKMTAKVLEAIVDLVGQVGEQLPPSAED